MTQPAEKRVARSDRDVLVLLSEHLEQRLRELSGPGARGVHRELSRVERVLRWEETRRAGQLSVLIGPGGITRTLAVFALLLPPALLLPRHADAAIMMRAVLEALIMAVPGSLLTGHLYWRLSEREYSVILQRARALEGVLGSSVEKRVERQGNG